MWKFAQKTSDFRQELLAFQSGVISISDAQIDRLLELDASRDWTISHVDLNHRYGAEQFTYEGTPYHFARRLIQVAQPTETDIVYDLGSGYGRVVLYGAAVNPAQFRGIEIVPERNVVAEAVRVKLGLDNAQFITSNIADADFTDGTVFFLFNPFQEQTFLPVLDRLRDIAKTRSIVIAVWGGGSMVHFEDKPWLAPLDYGAVSEAGSKLIIYRSRRYGL